jgi:hypothetical protein
MTEVTVAESAEEWTLTFADPVVTQLRVDYGFTLLLGGGVEIRIEQPFQLTLGASDALTVPPGESVWDVGAALPLFNMHVATVQVERGGVLHIGFDENASIEVPTHPQWENWALHTPDGGIWVGTPGGGVTVFPGGTESADSGSAP